MRAMTLLTVLGDVDDGYIDNTLIEKASPPRMVLPKMLGVVAAACVALTIVAISLLHSGRADNNGVVLTPLAEPTGNTTVTTTLPPQTTSTKYVLVDPAGCYARSPEVGEVFLELYSLDTLRADPNARMWVQIAMKDANGQPVLSSEAKYNEIDRLVSLGYEIYIYESYSTDYWGAPRHITYVFGMLTAEQLENFAIGDFGYSISSGYTVSIPFEDCQRVK